MSKQWRSPNEEKFFRGSQNIFGFRHFIIPFVILLMESCDEICGARQKTDAV